MKGREVSNEGKRAFDKAFEVAFVLVTQSSQTHTGGSLAVNIALDIHDKDLTQACSGSGRAHDHRPWNEWREG